MTDAAAYEWPRILDDWATPRVIRQAVRAETLAAIVDRRDLDGLPGPVIAELMRSAA